MPLSARELKFGLDFAASIDVYMPLKMVAEGLETEEQANRLRLLLRFELSGKTRGNRI
jgi:hypothetical protein